MEETFSQVGESFHREAGLQERLVVVILRKSRNSAKNKAIRDLHRRVACATLKKLQM